MSGILWVLRSGACWKDLLPKYGSRSTCHRRLQEWQDQGVWEGIRLKFLSSGWQIRAWQGGEDIAYGWKGKGNTIHLVIEGNGLPLAFLVIAANPRRVWKNRRRRPGRPPGTHEASKFRWKVERSHGWLDNWWRLVTRYDRYTESYLAFLTIACFRVTPFKDSRVENFGTGSYKRRVVS